MWVSFCRGIFSVFVEMTPGGRERERERLEEDETLIANWIESKNQQPDWRGMGVNNRDWATKYLRYLSGGTGYKCGGIHSNNRPRNSFTFQNATTDKTRAASFISHASGGIQTGIPSLIYSIRGGLLLVGGNGCFLMVSKYLLP